MLVKSGENVENDFKNLVIPLENRWQSARNLFTGRRKLYILGNVAGGAGCLVSLASTYYSMSWKQQIICYTLSISILMLTDPLKLFSRILAKSSRCMVVASNILLILCILTNVQNLWLVYLITFTIFFILIFFLNDLWLKTENWNMSKEVEHSLHGDPNNRAGTSWQANGRTKTRTILYSLGVKANDTDIDTIMKAVYSVGYWNCYSIQQDQMDNIKELNSEIEILKKELEEKNTRLEDAGKTISKYVDLDRNLIAYENANAKNAEIIKESKKEIATLTNEYDELIDEYNELAEKYNTLLDLYQKATEKKEEPVDDMEEDIEEDDTEENLPKGVSLEQYTKVCELLAKKESFRYIEKVTSVSRYRIKQCIEYQRKNAIGKH